MQYKTYKLTKSGKLKSRQKQEVFRFVKMVENFQNNQLESPISPISWSELSPDSYPTNPPGSNDVISKTFIEFGFVYFKTDRWTDDVVVDAWAGWIWHDHTCTWKFHWALWFDYTDPQALERLKELI